MGEFFNGWRRKAGCVTLVMACMLMLGWVRSYFYLNSFQLWGNGHSSSWMQSRDGGLERWISAELSDEALIERARRNAPKRMMDLGFIPITGSPNEKKMSWRISYWLLTSPLTLLSAYLLLGKPRVAKPQKTIVLDRA